MDTHKAESKCASVLYYCGRVSYLWVLKRRIIALKRILNGFVIGIMIVLLFAGWQMYQDNNDSSITVIEQIKKVAKLQTIEMKAATTLSKSKKDWAGATKYTVYFAEGTVTASIDLEKMEIELDEEKNLVLIKLPKKVEISNASHDSFKIVCTHGTLTAPSFTDAERSRHINQAFAIIRKKAIKARISTMALKNAKEYLTTFINALGRDVEFG